MTQITKQEFKEYTKQDLVRACTVHRRYLIDISTDIMERMKKSNLHTTHQMGSIILGFTATFCDHLLGRMNAVNEGLTDWETAKEDIARHMQQMLDALSINIAKRTIN